jgi:uncharacterized protein (DUF3084 family)
LEWSHALTAILTALSTGGVLSAVFTFLLKSREDGHRREREDRSGELEVLYKHIEELRSDRDAIKTELGKSRDEHQACMMKQALLEQRMADLEAREKEREDRAREEKGSGT